MFWEIWVPVTSSFVHVPPTAHPTVVGTERDDVRTIQNCWGMAQALQQRAQVLLPNLPDPIELNTSMCCNKLDTNRPHSQTTGPKRAK